MTLEIDEFLRRFLLHVLPPAFCASATSDPSPIDDMPLCCRFCFHLLGTLSTDSRFAGIDAC
jgi:hypothetical protein